MAVRTRRQRQQEAEKKGKRWPYAAAAAIAAVVAAHYYNATVIRSDDLGTGTMFDRIAPHYDKANDFMSLGLHHGWREALIAGLDISSNDNALDLATGTADVAILQGKRGATVVLTLPSMLEIGRGKVTGKHARSQARVGGYLPNLNCRSTTRSRSAWIEHPRY